MKKKEKDVEEMEVDGLREEEEGEEPAKGDQVVFRRLMLQQGRKQGLLKSIVRPKK